MPRRHRARHKEDWNSWREVWLLKRKSTLAGILVVSEEIDFELIWFSSALDARVDWMNRYAHELSPDKVRGHKVEIVSYQNTIGKYKRLAAEHRGAMR